MNSPLMINSLILIFAQGAYCLLIAIFAFNLLRQYKVRLKLYFGILLSAWVLFNIKYLVIYSLIPNSIQEQFNWITMTDQLTVPMVGIVMQELYRPRSVTWIIGILNMLPFVLLLALYCFMPSQAVLYATLASTCVYSAVILVESWRSLKVISADVLMRKAVYNITCLFLIPITVWVLSCIFYSPAFDVFYFITTGIALYFIYYNVDLIFPHEALYNPVRDFTTTEAHPFDELINQLFEQEKLFLNPDLVLTDVARMIGTNRSYLSKYFNEQRNMSFHDYVNNLRLEHVESLINSKPEFTIEEIALTSGFNSISTFRRAFVKKYGATPSQYRQTLKLG